MTVFADKKIVVTGASGFVGRHVVSALRARGISDNQIAMPRSDNFDLRNWDDCVRAVAGANLVVHLAAFSGGVRLIEAEPGRMFYDNTIMGLQLLEAARQAGVSKFLTVGSVYAYPHNAPIPLREETLWEGYPKASVAGYGIAKRVLVTALDTYRAEYGMNTAYLILANIYGPGDNFDLEDGKVLPSLIRRVFEAKQLGAPSISVWGSGTPTRDFLYVEDAAEGIVRALESDESGLPANLGAGIETSVRDLVELIAKLSDFKGEIVWDTTKPQGQPRFCVDISRARAHFGFEPSVSLEDGLRRTIDWYAKTRGAI